MGVKLTGFDNVIDLLDRLSKKETIDAATKKAVNAAKGVVAKTMQSAIAASEQGPNSTGSVAASVVTTDAKVNSYGTYSVAKPSGMHPSGKRNAEVAAFLEYGASNLGSRPWRSRAVTAAEPQVVEIMKQVINDEFDLD